MKRGKQSKLEALECENRLLKAIIENCNESIYAVNTNDEIIIYNKQTEIIEGLKSKDALGKKESEIFPDYKKRVTDVIVRNSKPLIEQVIKYRIPDGREIMAMVSAFPFHYRNKLTAIYTIGRTGSQINQFITNTMEMQKKLFREKYSDRAVYFLDDIIGTSKKIRKAVNLAKMVARRDSPILIIGETGTGKELFAQGIHNASMYSKGQFVPLNCAAIPETLLESLLFGTTRGGIYRRR